VSARVYVGSDDDNLYALDAAPAGNAGPSRRQERGLGPDRERRRRLFGSWDGSLYAVDATTGRKQWAYPTDNIVLASRPWPRRGLRRQLGREPVRGGYLDRQEALDLPHRRQRRLVRDRGRRVVYFGSADHHLYAVDAATGRKHWAFPADDAVYSSPTVVDASSTSAATTPTCTRWTRQPARNAGPSHQRCRVDVSTVVDGVVYVGSDDANLYALDATTGKKRWAFATHNTLYSSPTVVDGVVYFGSLDSSLYAVDAKTGKERWAFLTGREVSSSPAVVGGVVYFAALTATCTRCRRSRRHHHNKTGSGEAPTFSTYRTTVRRRPSRTATTRSLLHYRHLPAGQSSGTFRPRCTPLSMDERLCRDKLRVDTSGKRAPIVDCPLLAVCPAQAAVPRIPPTSGDGGNSGGLNASSG